MRLTALTGQHERLDAAVQAVDDSLASLARARKTTPRPQAPFLVPRAIAHATPGQRTALFRSALLQPLQEVS